MQQQHLFPDDEVKLIAGNLAQIIQELDDARNRAVDPPGSMDPLSHTSRTGGPGRPRVQIDESVLSSSLLIDSKATLASMLGCSARTVRRRQLEIEEEKGVQLIPQRSAFSEDELDTVVGGILLDFPHYGRSMLMGAIAVRGHNVPERQVRESLDRVRGAPGRFFGSRPIHRRKYYVPAANSLWHHDGQHGMLSADPHDAIVFERLTGLIRWKIVIHGFIDGKTRFVVGLRAHNNNRADTVLDFFLDITDVHGCPSRVRGDHGVENTGVARHMETVMGENRGSYIWGRLVIYAVILFFLTQGTGAFTTLGSRGYGMM